jgi:hypothetical protein
MTQELRISCIKKNDRQGAHERIHSVGGVNADGSRWKLVQAQAIAQIKGFRISFYVERPPGHRARVIVARSAAGHEYLKTEADGEQPNNLLSLPECP